MAVDDFTAILSINLADGSSFNRQPGAGVEEMYLMATCNGQSGSSPYAMPAMTVHQIDGTNDQSIIEDGDGGNGCIITFRMKMIANNTNYFKSTNNSGGTGDCGNAFVVIG
jgi:hypothetical protein